MNADEPFQHLRLIHRQTCINEAEQVTVETSLYQSSVTGCYMLEQVVHGRRRAIAPRSPVWSRSYIAELQLFLLKLSNVTPCGKLS